MREKIKQLLGALLGSGFLILVVLGVFAAVSLLGGGLMSLFGFACESLGSLLLYFLAGELISLPLELVIVGLSRALYQRGHVSGRQANLLYIPLDAMATVFAYGLAGRLVSGVTVSSLALWVLGLCAAVITVPVKRTPAAK